MVDAGAATATIAAPAAYGCTEVFMQAFFPTAYLALRRHPALWALLQPPWLADRCPERSILLELPGGGSLALRNAELLPWQLAGVAVALLGRRRLRGGHTYLRFSLLFFALMNASSILCHALVAPHSWMWHAALLADILCTGCSSLCLLMAQVMPAPTRPATASAARRRCLAVLAALLAVCIANLWLQLPLIPEAMYLGTTAAAATATAHRLQWHWLALPASVQRRQLPLLLLAALALLLLAGCLPLDPLLCAVAGPWLGTVPLLFAGSDLGFAALTALAAAEEAEGTAHKRPSRHIARPKAQ